LVDFKRKDREKKQVKKKPKEKKRKSLPREKQTSPPHIGAGV
jgi:hypothetical protein